MNLDKTFRSAWVCFTCLYSVNPDQDESIQENRFLRPDLVRLE